MKSQDENKNFLKFLIPLILILSISSIFPNCSIQNEANSYDTKKVEKVTSKINRIYEEFGYSAFCLAEIFQNAIIDVIDAEIEGEDNRLGSELTRQIANKYYPLVRLTQ